jgi:hypothetical protein
MTAALAVVKRPPAQGFRRASRALGSRVEAERQAEAAEVLRALLAVAPGFTVAKAAVHLALRDAPAQEVFLGGLRMAGLPGADAAGTPRKVGTPARPTAPDDGAARPRRRSPKRPAAGSDAPKVKLIGAAKARTKRL